MAIVGKDIAADGKNSYDIRQETVENIAREKTMEMKPHIY